jgi:hypothetical protein
VFTKQVIISVIKLRGMRWAGYVVRKQEMKNSNKITIVEVGGKRPLVRSRRRWEDTIKVGFEGICCIQVTQNRAQCQAVMKQTTNVRSEKRRENS